MNAGGECYAVAPGMKRDWHLMLCSHRGDLSDFSDATGARDIRLDKIHCAARNEIFERIAHVQVFTDGDRCLAFLAERRVALDVFDEQRLLEPIRTTLGKSIGGFKRDIERISLIGVGHNDKIFS